MSLTSAEKAARFTDLIAYLKEIVVTRFDAHADEEHKHRPQDYLDHNQQEIIKVQKSLDKTLLPDGFVAALTKATTRQEEVEALSLGDQKIDFDEVREILVKMAALRQDERAQALLNDIGKDLVIRFTTYDEEKIHYPHTLWGISNIQLIEPQLTQYRTLSINLPLSEDWWAENRALSHEKFQLEHRFHALKHPNGKQGKRLNAQYAANINRSAKMRSEIAYRVITDMVTLKDTLDKVFENNLTLRDEIKFSQSDYDFPDPYRMLAEPWKHPVACYTSVEGMRKFINIIKNILPDYEVSYEGHDSLTRIKDMISGDFSNHETSEEYLKIPALRQAYDAYLSYRNDWQNLESGIVADFRDLVVYLENLDWSEEDEIVKKDKHIKASLASCYIPKGFLYQLAHADTPEKLKKALETGHFSIDFHQAKAVLVANAAWLKDEKAKELLTKLEPHLVTEHDVSGGMRGPCREQDYIGYLGKIGKKISDINPHIIFLHYISARDHFSHACWEKNIAQLTAIRERTQTLAKDFSLETKIALAKLKYDILQRNQRRRNSKGANEFQRRRKAIIQQEPNATEFFFLEEQEARLNNEGNDHYQRMKAADETLQKGLPQAITAFATSTQLSVTPEQVLKGQISTNDAKAIQQTLRYVEFRPNSPSWDFVYAANGKVPSHGGEHPPIDPRLLEWKPATA